MECVRRGTTKSAIACESKWEPPEKLYDKDAGMYYFNARWYDSEIGRFVTQDPARDGANWYAYCGGNPVNYTDPTGLSTCVDEKTGTILSATNDNDSGVYSYPTVDGNPVKEDKPGAHIYPNPIMEPVLIT